MKTFFKYIAYVCTACLLYVLCMHSYVGLKFRPQTLLSAPVDTLSVPENEVQVPLVWLHQVSTPERAARKEARYDGYETDIMVLNGVPFIAHEKKDIEKHITLRDIFQSLEHPEKKYWWLDLKMKLSEDDLTAILAVAAHFNIPQDHLFFEAVAGKTAERIHRLGLQLLLQLPEEFTHDGNNAQRRAELNARLAGLVTQYRPVAVSASFGKYPLLHGYFPSLPKAIYYTTVRRPSLKKYFIRKHFEQDPSVKIFLLEEYTFL